MTPSETSGGDEAEAALWMIAQLSPQTQRRVRRRLALRLEPPPSPAEARRHELRFVADLLCSAAKPPGWSLPYVPRSHYDSKRPTESPSSAALVERYGTWVTVCRHAHHLVTGAPNRLPKHRRRANSKATRRYSEEDAAAALRECARELNRTPSSSAYAAWHTAAEQRRRGSATYPTGGTIRRRYAERGGWIAALEGAGLAAPPATTVRVMARNKRQAVELAAIARASAFIATHAGNRNWIEVRGTLLEVKRELVDLTARLGNATTLWEPSTGTLERLATKPPTGAIQLEKWDAHGTE